MFTIYLNTLEFKLLSCKPSEHFETLGYTRFTVYVRKCFTPCTQFLGEFHLMM